jgi:hypothetical protein
MIVPVLFATALVLAPVQTTPQTSPAPAAPATGQTAAAAPRQICRLETVTGSSRRTRVCRAPAAPGSQDLSTREMMRDLQRARIPDQG